MESTMKAMILILAVAVVVSAAFGQTATTTSVPVNFPAHASYSLTDSELLTLARMIYEPENAPESFVTASGRTLFIDPKCGAMNLELLMVELQRPTISPELRQKIQLLIQGATDDLDEEYNTVNFTIDYNDTPNDPDCVFQPTVTHPTASNTQGEPVPWYVYHAGEYLEYSRTKYIEFGFEEPGSVGLSNVDIHNLVDAYGQTAPLSPIELDNDMCGDLPADWIYPYLAATAAHELFHQVEYQYVLPPDPDASAAWIKEGSAAWAEDAVYDGTNEYVNKMAQGDPGASPSIIHEDPNQDLTGVSYQAVSFWKNLTEWLGHNTTEPQVGIDLMLALWQEWDSILSDGTAAVNTVLQQTTWGSHTYDEAFHRWAITNRVKDFGNQPAYDYREDENCPHYLWGYTITDYPEMSPPTTQLSVGSSLPYFGTVNAWANKYYEFNVAPGVTGITVNCDQTSGSPYWQVITIDNSNVTTTYQSSAANYDLNIPVVNFSKLIVIISGNANAAGYAITVAAPQIPGTQVSGDVSGTWTLAGSPYNVTADISVAANQSLTIQPGVHVIFQGHYKFNVLSNATLIAEGTEQDSIHFIAATPATGWWGVRFTSSNPYSRLSYCYFQYGRATGSGNDYYGGAINCSNFSPIISHCRIDHCTAVGSGGGIYISTNVPTNPFIQYCSIDSCTSGSYGGGVSYSTGPLGLIMRNCVINNCRSINNTTISLGGGIFCGVANSAIDSCVISNNTAVQGGGGIYSSGNNITIDNCVINNNRVTSSFQAHGGGGIELEGNNATVRNCLIIDNTGIIGSGGIWFYGGTGQLSINNTIAGNGPNGIGVYSSQNGVTVRNCIIWSNSAQIGGSNVSVSYSDVQGGYTGTGNINLDPQFVPNGYYLSQLGSGQTVQSPCVNAGDPASSMIIGTTRTDGLQDQDIVDMGYHYAITAPPPPVVISMDPVNPPIVVPAAGGSFQFDINVQNTTTSPQTTQLWCNITIPGGQQFTSIPVQNLTLPAGGNLTRLRTQVVPANAPAGYYTYMGFLGTYPWNIVTQDGFQFQKSGTTSDWFGPEGWENSGEDFEEIEEQFITHNSSLITSLTPNPFNPSTTIHFDLPLAGRVTLQVFDIGGRNVGSAQGRPLRDVWMPAGSHEVTFDGSGLPSGVYLYRLTAGENTAVGKMVLLK